MKTIERVRALFPDGATIRCVENTYIPAHNGTLRRITGGGVGYRECVILTGPRARDRGVMYLPTRASDVLSVTDSSVTFKLPRRPGHTNTLEVVAEDDPAGHPPEARAEAWATA